MGAKHLLAYLCGGRAVLVGWLACVGLSVPAVVVDVTPGQSLEWARDSVRNLRAQGMKGVVTIRLAAGRYELHRELTLDGRDSDVVWCAASGTEVRVSGGLLIESEPERVTDAGLLTRLPASARGQVVQFDLVGLGVTDLGDYLYNYEDEVQRRVANTWNQGEFIMGSHPPPDDRSTGRLEVFVDDRPMTVARTPTNVVFHVDRLLGTKVWRGPGAGTEVCQEARFISSEELPLAWDAEPDAHLCGCWCRDWAEQHQRIVSYDRSRRAIELSKPWHQYCYRAGAEFFGFNLLCELDEPGEWYVDRSSGKMLAWLPPGDSHRIEVSRTGRLFELTGATNVVFRNMTFEACRNSAVRMKDCESSRLESCIVRNVGQHALIVEDGHACGARDCQFHDMGGGGVFLVDGNRMTLQASEHFVEGCDIHDFGRWNRMYRPGICLSGVGQRAVGNRIHDSPHAAILFFGCDLLMQSNEVYRTNCETKDCGAFYSGRSWMLRGNRILDNFFHDVIGLRGAYTRTIYLDDSMADTLIAGNRFERCTWAVFIGGSRDNVITNNVFVDCPNALYVDARGRGWQKPHIEGRLKEMREQGTLNGIPLGRGAYVERYPAVKSLLEIDPYSPEGNVIADNVFERGEGVWLSCHGRPGLVTSPDWWRDGLSLEELVVLGTLRNNMVDGRRLNMGVWYTGANGGAFGDARNWMNGRIPSQADRVVIPRGRTVVVGADDYVAFTNQTTIHLEDATSALELRNVDADLAVGHVQLTGRGEFRAVGTGPQPRRVVLRQDNSQFGGSFFFTNAAVSVHGPKTLGRSCPVTFCKTTAGGDCVFNFAAPGIYSSDLTFLAPQGAMWFAVSTTVPEGMGRVINRGRIAIPLMRGRYCGRISSPLAPFIQEGLLDLGARIDLCGDVTLKCPVRFRGRDEEFFTDDRAGRLRFGDGFSWSGDAELAESFVRLLTPGVLGPWKELEGRSDDPTFGARVLAMLPDEWHDVCRVVDDGHAIVLKWRDPTAPQ